MKTKFSAPDDYFAHMISKFFRSPVKNLQCFPLTGDASDRNYFRIKFNSHKTYKSSIVAMMQINPPIRKDIPFVTTQAFLKKCRIKVPKLYYIDSNKGFIFLDDLGDITLEEKLNASSPAEQEKYYKKAIDILLRMQIECTRKIDKSIPAHDLSFDLEKLIWELDFMSTHFIEGFFKKTVSEKDKTICHDEFFKICSLLSKQKRYFCHRDYHSRNIMINNNELVLLDFQDARMGPCQYDLASLLRDSYFKLDKNLFDKLLDDYINKKEETEQAPVKREDFLKVFDWMCIQRNLKALGTFGYQINVNRNERYRDAIPRTVEYVLDNLSKYDDLKSLKKCLQVLLN